MSNAGDPRSLLLPETLAAIEVFFRNENQSFAQAYFGRDELFGDRSAGAAAPPYAPTPTDADMIVFLGGLVLRMEERIDRLEQLEREKTRGSAPGPSWGQ